MDFFLIIGRSRCNGFEREKMIYYEHIEHIIKICLKGILK